VLDLTADAAPTVGSYFVSSAASPALRASAPPGAKQLPGAAARGPAPAIQLPGGGKGGAAGAAGVIAAPQSKEELGQWKAAIAGHERWGAAAPLVLDYYRRHGFGVTSRNSTLRWAAGCLVVLRLSPLGGGGGGGGCLGAASQVLGQAGCSWGVRHAGCAAG
jgi:hypothetical protein